MFSVRLPLAAAPSAQAAAASAGGLRRGCTPTSSSRVARAGFERQLVEPVDLPELQAVLDPHP